MENEEGLVLVDQHAAHERILFEKLRRQMESEGVPTQRLLIPLTVASYSRRITIGLRRTRKLWKKWDSLWSRLAIPR